MPEQITETGTWTKVPSVEELQAELARSKVKKDLLVGLIEAIIKELERLSEEERVKGGRGKSQEISLAFIREHKNELSRSFSEILGKINAIEGDYLANLRLFMNHLEKTST